MDTKVSLPKLKSIEGTLGLSRAELLQVINPPIKQVDAWLDGEVFLPECQCVWNELREVSYRLLFAFQLTSITEWLNQPSRYLGGELPIALIRSGQIDKVIEAIRAMEESVYI